MTHVGVDSSSVADVVGCIGVSGSQDPLANQQGLHSHAVGVADDLLQLVEVGHFQGVLVGGDWTGQHHFGTYQLTVNESEKYAIPMKKSSNH